MTMIPKLKRPLVAMLTRQDWEEIYYALDTKVRSRACQGNNRRSKQWRGHLRRIMRTIGPDGRNMIPPREAMIPGVRKSSRLPTPPPAFKEELLHE